MYHIVFATKFRAATITNSHREDLYRFIWRLVTDRNCKLLRINGTPDHLHILLNLHPTITLSALVRDIKAHSSGWMHRDSRFPLFQGWGKEYFAATVSYAGRMDVVEYIKSQQEHHNVVDFDSELELLFTREGMDINNLNL